MEKNPADDVKASARCALASVLKNKDEASQAEAERLFQTVIDESAKVPDRQQRVEQARNALAEMKVRGIGKAVPDIVGTDLDGKPFKLSDYKGKVVLLDFWGFW
jgi:cytochrome oxidase Cu insertion factor (SCO1/SenC/PrrC family)